MATVLTDIPLIEGTVSVDGSRSERRRADLTVYNEGGALDPVEGKLWYDHIIQLRRGITDSGVQYNPVVFTGRVERRSVKYFSNAVKLVCRDMSSVLDQEFGVYEEYNANDPLEEVIRDIALAGGLDPARINLPLSGLDIGPKEIVYTPSSSRWEAMRRLADTHNQDLFFDATGVLVMRDFPRILGSQVSHLFTTGVDGNIGEYSKDQTVAPIRNVVAVVGESTANERSYYGVAENNDPTSPTRISLIGRRPVTVSRPEVTSDNHATYLANRLLEEQGRERFDISAEVVPDPRWEANNIVQFDRLDPNDGEGSRYVLESFSFKLEPGPATIKLSRFGNAATDAMVEVDDWLDAHAIVTGNEDQLTNYGVTGGTFTLGNAPGATILADGQGLSLPNVTGNYARCPDITGLATFGFGLRIRIWHKPPDITPATDQTLMAKATAADKTFEFRLKPTARLELRYSTDGTNWIADEATANITTDYVAFEVEHWPTGETWFRISEDGVTFTQLGAQVSGTSGNLHQAATQVGIGGWSDGTGQLDGIVEKAELYHGTVLHADPNFTTENSGTLQHIDGLNNAWDIIEVTDAYDPTLTPDITDPFIVFGGGELIDMNVTPSYTSTTGQISVAWCGRIGGSANGGRLLSAESAVANGFYLSADPSGKVALRNGDGTPESVLTGTDLRTGDTLFALAAVVDNGTAYLYATDGTSTSMSLTKSPTFGAFRVGSRSDALANHLTGDVAAVVVEDGKAWTATEADNILDWLITRGHPPT